MATVIQKTHPLTWRLNKQAHVRGADDYEALEGYAGFKKHWACHRKMYLTSLKLRQ